MLIEFFEKDEIQKLPCLALPDTWFENPELCSK